NHPPSGRVGDGIKVDVGNLHMDSYDASASLDLIRTSAHTPIDYGEDTFVTEIWQLLARGTHIVRLQARKHGKISPWFKAIDRSEISHWEGKMPPRL
ncbi:MAG TPA: hypothetical protein VGJ87_06580, partial [Roseiflexaceae bacterium]